MRSKPDISRMFLSPHHQVVLSVVGVVDPAGSDSSLGRLVQHEGVDHAALGPQRQSDPCRRTRNNTNNKSTFTP